MIAIIESLISRYWKRMLWVLILLLVISVLIWCGIIKSSMEELFIH